MTAEQELTRIQVELAAVVAQQAGKNGPCRRHKPAAHLSYCPECRRLWKRKRELLRQQKQQA
jgi:hypothetical protein